MTEQIAGENDIEAVLNADARPKDQVTEAAQRVEDHDTPAGDPADVSSDLEDTHPNTDGDIDEHERYDQGL
jgi:hypothetical protein